MEESTEAHMETDVSSTTEDVPETQEVTGSHGSVEMVIVVEKLEEDMNTNILDKETSQIEDNTNVVSATTEHSPQKVPKMQVSLLKSPNKVSEPEKSPSKSESPLKTVNKVSQPNDDQSSADSQQTEETEVVDSSSIEPQPLGDTEENNTSKEPQKPAEKSPVKDLQTQELLITKPFQKTPIKEVVLQEPSKATNNPVKEFTLPENSVINGKLQSNDIVKQDDLTTKQQTPTKVPIDVTIEKEASNDSQVESITDPTEKEHNKSISRELKSLINSAKESKIISECNQLTSKTRKSRNMDTSNLSMNTSVEAEKIQGIRRYSNNSQKSNCSEKSDKAALKRSMRSQNPEFVNKVKLFLNSVTGKAQKDSDDEEEEVEEKEKSSKEKTEQDESLSNAPAPKIKKTEDAATEKHHKLRSDPYCWRCHWAVEQAANEKAHAPMLCTVCPRSFHYKCLTSTERSKINIEKNWVCPECMIVLQAESSETRSPAMKKITLGMLCELLSHALARMMEINGVEPFMQPVDRSAFPDYDKYVVHPMDLSLMRDNIAQGLYGSTEAFLADAQWILHNSIIFNTLQSRLTGGARALVRGCRAQVAEVEACPECYAAAHQRRPTWFTDVCTTPHVLLWAKLKGFPFWPAKGMSVSAAGHVDVRFFGAHDRAWVPAKDCYLFSEKDPNNFRTKRQDILDSMQEAEQHIRNISRKYGKFVYPPFKTQFDPSRLYEQLKMMIPSFEGEVKAPLKPVAASPAASKEKSRSNSKSSKGSVNDGDVSECEDTQAVSSRKMADGAEIAREDEDTISDKNNASMDVDTPQVKGNESSRKRRRSELEEAVITIIETSTSSADKKKRVEDITDEKKPEHEEPTSSKEVDNNTLAADKHKDVEMDVISKDKTEEVTPKAKDNEPSSSTAEKDKKDEKRNSLRVTPIRIALVQKDKKNTLKSKETAKIISPKDNAKTVILNKDNTKPITSNKDDKNTPQRQRPVKQAPNATPRDDKSKSEKRRNSRNNRSLNNSFAKDKNGDKKADKNTENNKDKSKENSANKVLEKDKVAEKQPSLKPTNVDSPKSVKDRLQFDDDTTLAVIARESGKGTTNGTGLPTITSVRSLSTTPSTINTVNKPTNNGNTIEVTVEANSECSIFTPTSTDNVRTMKDAVSKLQKLRNDTEPVVGRVGVRAFARMTSPEKTALEKQNKNDDVQVEIKAEPIDLDDPERHMEKMDLMNAFKLRPVNPTNLREVRINKVVVTPLPARKVVKPVEMRPRAKKTFPQPKKPDDGRSELNGKNSMVYIPIQPPVTQAPLRAVRAGPTGTPAVRPIAPVNTSVVTNLTNTITSPVMQVSSLPASPGGAAGGAAGSVAATVGPATVHTVPLMTSVNGQWMFSFQPVMSVGAIDRSGTPPLVNGVCERSAPPLTPLGAAGPAPAQHSHPPPAQHTPTQIPPVQHSSPAVLSTTPAHSCTRTPTDSNTPGEPPRLLQRPAVLLLNPLDPTTPAAPLPPPAAAGPITAKLNQNAVKLADYFRTLLEDSLEKVEDPAAQLAALRLQHEQALWRHKQQIDEIKHIHELSLAEMRASLDKEKLRAASEARRAAQLELEAAVKRAKAKQWCANCSQEAQFYCCWNTSYCDYPCQRAHWAQHFSVCTQQRSQEGSNGTGDPPSSPEHRLQPQPDMPKNTSAPALTVGGKLAPSRVYAQDQPASQKASIIVSMVEDPNGNQTMKCVGTYKPPAPAQPPPPIILNKQLLNSEESVNKKVVSTGGYLIVGGSSSQPAVSAARRTHTVQYYS